ncbi:MULTISPECIES: IS3 family transposase [Bacillus cereus group]|uniref:Transposase n=1 Tax=Bacillus thuringiensis TaxID=1428 RepID=A0AAP4Q128_BACTU|nr:hypothetical protein [Bacillus thuringiensis]MDN7075565.1 hypothetical protein [Bacillus thuringiensis]MDQ7253498.1 hypothetical protein [Bacillus thuringiensis]MDR5027229.1 hypothetical protein [Bacillus thuringiensis]MDV6348917.1 hypothetical protein [Bacillus thuringiensis]
MQCYNHQRFQEKLNNLSPYKYRLRWLSCVLKILSI